MNKDEHILHNKYQSAIDLRLLGYTYKQIAKNLLTIKEHTVRTWFMQDGICYSEYQSQLKRKQEENQELLNHAWLQLNEISIEAIKTLRQSVSGGNVNASLKLLNLIGIQKYLTYESKPNEGIDLLRKIVESLEKDSKKKSELKTT